MTRKGYLVYYLQKLITYRDTVYLKHLNLLDYVYIHCYILGMIWMYFGMLFLQMRIW